MGVDQMLKNRTSKNILTTLGTIALIIFIFAYLPQSIGIFEKIFKIIAPIMLGVAIAFILNIPLKKLERLWDKIFNKHLDKNFIRAIRRPICLVLCILIVLCIFVGLLFMLVPQVISTLNGFVKNIPSYVTQIKGWWESLVIMLEEYSIELPHWEFDTDKLVSTLTKFLTSGETNIIGSSINFAGSIFGLVFDLVVAFVLSIYIIDHKERLVKNTKRGLAAFFSEKTVNKVFDIMLLVNRTFSNFLSGQLIEAIILAVLCFIGMLIFRMPYALLISTMIGITALIPIFGGFIGAGFGAFFILLEEPIKALWFLVFIIVLQQLEGNLIYPRVVGKKVGLPGLWVLIAVTVGSSFGIVGMLISVPICSVLYCLIDQLIHYYERKKAGELKDDETPFSEIFEEEEEENTTTRKIKLITIPFNKSKKSDDSDTDSDEKDGQAKRLSRKNRAKKCKNAKKKTKLKVKRASESNGADKNVDNVDKIDKIDTVNGESSDSAEKIEVKNS